MAFDAYRKIRVPPGETPTSKQINDVQDNVAKAISQVLGKDQLDSSLLKNIQLTVGLNRVGHKLGRTLQGWTIIRTHGNFPLVYDIQDLNTSPDILLDLMSATVCTIDLLVF